ncbi:class A beta-lactamase [Yinghuangia sp. YIM S09857]|uniref:class A beta-lactamase n=1 Tax=Yinghuangia sp. YIM S09857 TaxID=3436929 RepID=UPI003F531C95
MDSSGGPTRRAVLAVLAAVAVAGCADDGGSEAAAQASGAAPTGVPAVGASGGPARLPAPAPAADFAALERAHDARLGVFAVATGSGAEVAYRADERFAFCSTFKALAVAAVLGRRSIADLEERITFTGAEVDSISPITRDRVATGMTVRELCDAAVRFSDGTAANLLVRDVGGPAALTAYLRGLGDTVSRIDHYEPELNEDPPGDPRDTTTPRAIAADFRTVVLGDALAADRRALLRDWLERNTTGDRRIRAGLPAGWRAADKTGTGNYGRANDIAVAWPPDAGPGAGSGGRPGAASGPTGPIVLAVMSDRAGYGTEPDESLIAAATALVVAGLGGTAVG